MTDYEKTVALWQRKKINPYAEIAEALNGYSIAFAYHSGRIENERVTYNDTREINIDILPRTLGGEGCQLCIITKKVF